jgi:hypothetical protein
MGFVGTFLACMMAIAVYSQLIATKSSIKYALGRHRMRKKLVGIKPEGGHYFRDGACVVCAFPRKAWESAPFPCLTIGDGPL